MANSRWEKKVNEYTTNRAKYEALKTEIENLKKGKVTGAKTKEQYEAALSKRKAEIQKKEAEYKGYENFKKNEDKLKNILEYRKTLEKKLAALPKDTREDVSKKQEEQKKLTAKIKEYQKSVEDMKKMLKGDIAEDVKQVTLFAIKTRMDALGALQEQQGKLDMEIADLQEQGKNFNEETAGKKELYERRIAKCNLLAANLLKGKSIDDIGLRVEEEGKKFNSPDGSLKDKTDSARQEGGIGAKDDTALEPVSEFAKKHPRLAKIGNFFKNLKDKTVDFIRGKEEDEEEQETGGAKPEVKEDVAKMFEDEDRLLKEIAEKGAEKTFKDRLKDNRTKTANDLARKHGGTYERQDGATEKKDKPKDQGMEPGE